MDELMDAIRHGKGVEYLDAVADSILSMAENADDALAMEESGEYDEFLSAY